MRSLYYPEELLKWEKNTKISEFISLDGCRAHGLVYCQSKKVVAMNGRDFVEKSFLFHENGVIYKYSSYIDNCHLIRAVPSDSVRGQSLFSFAMARRSPTDNKILFTNINQMDYKLKIPMFLKSSFLPKAAKLWYKEINNHL